MKYTLKHNQSGYSIIIAILTIGFLLVLTISTLNLVLQEMQDGKGKQDYMKAYAAAEGGLELAMLEIKEKGYGYFGEMQDKELFGTFPKNAKVSYSFDSKVYSYGGTLSPFASDIIPLFWINDSGVSDSVQGVNLSASSGIIWNIIGETGGISGTGNISSTTTVGEKKISTISGNTDFTFIENQNVQDFIASNSGSYLMVYNPLSTPISYTVDSLKFFTKPKAIISSSAKVGKYTQNLETSIDNTEFLGILKYSIYSGN